MAKRVVINLIKQNPLPYNLARSVRNGKETYKLLQGYYERNTGKVTFVIEHEGEEVPGKILYYIRYDWAKESGFFASLRFTLEQLYIAELLGYTPVVDWGKNSIFYYDKGMDNITENVFEYYFKPVCDISCQMAKNGSNVIYSHHGYQNYFLKHAGYVKSYLINENEIEKLADIYKKYIQLNKETVDYLKSELSSIFIEKKTLGVHVRGTDFLFGMKNHPVMVLPDEYVKKAREIFDSGSYEQVFLATDDLNALQLFSSEFKEKLVYYGDAVRTDNDTGPHETIIDRPLHHYRLGLEVLRDVYTLACCDSLIAGLSQVSFAARYINVALGRSFEKLVILEKGINAGSREALRKSQKLIKKYEHDRR